MFHSYSSSLVGVLPVMNCFYKGFNNINTFLCFESDIFVFSTIMPTGGVQYY